jgi:hypothetical protein
VKAEGEGFHFVFSVVYLNSINFFLTCQRNLWRERCAIDSYRKRLLISDLYGIKFLFS